MEKETKGPREKYNNNKGRQIITKRQTCTEREREREKCEKSLTSKLTE